MWLSLSVVIYQFLQKRYRNAFIQNLMISVPLVARWGLNGPLNSCVAERWKGHTNSRISKAGTLREQHGSKPILGPLDHCIGEVKEVSISPPILSIYVSCCIFFFGWLTPRFNEYTMISPTLAMLCVHPRTIQEPSPKVDINPSSESSRPIRHPSIVFDSLGILLEVLGHVSCIAWRDAGRSLDDPTVQRRRQHFKQWPGGLTERTSWCELFIQKHQATILQTKLANDIFATWLTPHVSRRITRDANSRTLSHHP